MSIFDSHSTGVLAIVRTGRHGRTCIEWSQPFEASLYIQKDQRGRCCVVALQQNNFAEFDPRHDEESSTLFVVEDYALEVLELPVGTKV